MSDLKLRKLPFDFEGVDFIWNPDEPNFSAVMNKISFVAVGFERYICRTIEDALPRITDPALLAEAKAFRAQEGIHSLAHRKHLKALIARYPGLQDSLDKTIAAYDDLYARESLDYHLGYVGGLESVFTPFFKLLLDHKERLFAGGDARVASLMLWHFCEEIEHRASGIAIYDHVVGRYFYRIRNYRGYMRHAGAVFAMLDDEFRRQVPDVPPELYAAKGAPLPRLARFRSFAGILAAQLPWHDAGKAALPAYFAEWSARYDRGEDMTQAYGVPWRQAA